MAQNLDLETSDRNIQINTDGRNIRVGGESEQPQQGSVQKLVQKQKEAYASTFFQSATERVTKSWYEKCLCGFETLKQYFNVTTADVRSRLLHSIIPFNPKFYDISEKSPDLYGPFWIYTTLIFIIAAAGSLAKYLNDITTRNFFQEFVPIAAGIIYGIGFGVPIVLAILMKCFGSASGFVSVICTYGYSYTIFIPVVIACSFPIELLQWILIAYAVFSSTSLIIVNYWKELSKYMEKKRYLLIGIVLVCQAGLFLVLKLYFFETLNKETKIILDTKNTTTSNTNNTSTSNSSVLLF